MNNQDTHESIRVKLWCDVCATVASSDNTTDINAPARWANAAVESFDKAFPSTKKEETKCGHFVTTGDNPINGMMCKPQSAQINCLAQNCYYNQGAGYCSHPAPEFTITNAISLIPCASCMSFKENID